VSRTGAEKDLQAAIKGKKKQEQKALQTSGKRHAQQCVNQRRGGVGLSGTTKKGRLELKQWGRRGKGREMTLEGKGPLEGETGVTVGEVGKGKLKKRYSQKKKNKGLL